MFVVMMLDVDFAELKRGSLQYFPISIVVGGILLAELVFAGLAWRFAPAAPQALASANPSGLTNTEALGQIIYTDYAYYFQLAGLILLVAMIGAIVLTLRHRAGVRRQSIRIQNAREPAETLALVDIKPGQGA